MQEFDRQNTQPLPVRRSNRPVRMPVLSRFNPGFLVPIAATGLHREDAVLDGRINVTVEMDETAEALINPVEVRLSAYLVPWLAFERFHGREEFEASYSGVEFKPGDGVIPFMNREARGAEGTELVLDQLGRHAPPGALVNTMYREAYNLIVNWRNKNLSLQLPQRTMDDKTLAPAMRNRGRHRNIVPNFDQAAMEGAVPIDVITGGQLPVSGLGIPIGQVNSPGSITVKDTAGGATVHTWPNYAATGSAQLVSRMSDPTSGIPDVYVEFEEVNASFSISQLNLAREAQAFAQMRKRYAGLEREEDIIKLMNGIRMPDRLLEQPVFLGEVRNNFGYATRYATDSANLDKSVVEGVSMLSMPIATPRINTGGVLMICAEVQPEQLFERQVDPWMMVIDVDHMTWPDYIRDTLDTQKVDVVKNVEMDSAHTDPGGTFGYQPMNGRWIIDNPAIGTGYFQPEPPIGFDEARARIWDTSPANPSLGEDWYLTTNVPTDVFQFKNRMPFEVAGTCDLVVNGNIVFGMGLMEGLEDYQKIMERAPGRDEQIDQTPPPA